ncbi:cell wall integrity and stress response component 3-like [Teleopsis dalmanni]|uniref:cell wall integrity and stress response component 3-like n=1 Tax=Teleopsis dalmanni TaxID=139649 RepID=UPI0018CDE90C|nr:cell wall integrity and stress response component 3-like [Teleopsis dalmanni]
MHYKILFFTFVYSLSIVTGQIISPNAVNTNNETKGLKQGDSPSLQIELSNDTNVPIESHKPRIRKVSDTSDSKPSKDLLNSTATGVSQQTKIVAENVVINVPTNLTSKTPVINSTQIEASVENVKEDVVKIAQPNVTTTLHAENTTSNSNVSTTAINKPTLVTVSNNGTSKTSADTTPKSVITITNSTAKPTTPTTTTTSTTSTTTTTTTSTTTTTTTTTTTPKPKKPTITYGVEDFPDLDGNLIKLNEALQQQSTTLPETSPVREIPNAQPSKEMNGFQINHSRDYIVPIVTLLFILPLVLGVMITAYRRFKDFWSTRHYRRMDFLVDGMYND